MHIKENVSELFPDAPDLGIKVVSYMGAPLLSVDGKTLGLLGVIDDKPMPEKANNAAIFHIFAARAAAELQRLNAEKEIEEKENKLQDWSDSLTFEVSPVLTDEQVSKVIG